MTTRTFLVLLVMTLALSVPLMSWDAAWAQAERPRIDPRKCSELQRQMDEIVAISRSTTMSEKEKMTKLTTSLAQSLKTMISSTAKDPDAAKIAREWKETLMGIMSSADVSGRAQGKDVPADAKRGVDIIRKRIQPYIAVMKLLCPNLVVPAAAGR